jgi:RNA-directed DNA polymerase
MTTEGTPQGGIIYPLLCNIALNGLEGHVKSVFPCRKAVNGIKPKVNIYRFADDLIVTGSNEEILSEI